MAIFFLVVRPIESYQARATATEEEAESDEERRHRELLEAIGNIGR